MTTTVNGIKGLRGVIVLWLGQFVSLVGTSMTRFAMSLWIWERTKSATAVALVWVFIFAPGILLSPVAGTFVDRWNRKRVLVVSDLVAGLATASLLLLFLSGGLQIWHVYLAALVASSAEAFQQPAQMASIINMVSPQELVRVNGLISMIQFGSLVIAPALAGTMLYTVGIPGVLGTDIGTFLFAVVLLLLVYIPQPAATAAGAVGAGSVWRETAVGFRYLRERQGLINLLGLFMIVNLIVAVFVGLINPTILARTGNNARLLGWILTINGLGGVLGGLLLGFWGGPKQRMQGVLGGMAVMNLLGIAVVGLGRSLPVWALGAFVVALSIPLINSCAMAILQTKVAPDLQGRVFGVVRLVAQISFPISLLIAGPLADYVFEPAMAPGGSLAPLFGALVGTGRGAGMSLLLVLSGLLGGVVGLGGYLVRAVRDVELLLPDPAIPPAGGETA